MSILHDEIVVNKCFLDTRQRYLSATAVLERIIDYEESDSYCRGFRINTTVFNLIQRGKHS